MTHSLPAFVTLLLCSCPHLPQVYTHRKAKSVEFMVVDALLAADEV